MRIVGLVSGGKDSVYNLMQCIAAGHEIVAIANIEPSEKKHELDSYMYQTVGHEAVSLLAGAISLPIYRHRTLGTAMCKDKVYVETENDEVEDLYNLLYKVKEEKHIEGVAVGAIASDYQRTRVENVCKRLNLKSFAYLWQRNQEELLEEMIQAEMEVIIIKVASLGLNPDVHLGMNIRELQPYVIELNRKFGVNVCGEGGEYETLVLDCPLFQRRINIIESEKIIHSSDAFAPVGYLNIKNATLEAKVVRSTDPLTSMEARISRIKKIIRTPFFYVQDCIDDLTAALFPEKKRLLSQPEILPHPFNSMTKTDEQASSGSIQEYWKGHKEGHHKEGQTSSATKQTTHVVTFSPSSILGIDTALCQLNYTSGWCSVANVTAPTVKEALGFVRKHLERVQFSMDDVVFVSMYINDMNEWPKANKMYSQCIRSPLPPARAFVSSPLPPDTAVQMVIIAHKLISKTQKVMHHTINRDNIYVQSVSNWAPANIGPYSQCVRVGDIVYVSGQIPLIPGTMELLNKPIFHQCRLALRHVSRILKCVDSNFSLSKILQATCFVTAEEIAVDIMEMWNYITRNVDAVVAVIVVTALPRNAQLEWQVIGCKYDKPVYDRSVEHLSDDVFMRCSRCRYPSQMTSSVSCSSVFTKKAFKLYKNKPIPADVIASILKFCLQYIRYEVANTGTPLSIVNIFYRSSDSHIATVLTDITKSTHEFKVVVSVIPIVGFSEPEIFLIITGVSH